LWKKQAVIYTCRRGVIEQFDVSRFAQSLNTLRLVRSPETLAESLQALVEPIATDN
jgi:hypothetical protein